LIVNGEVVVRETRESYVTSGIRLARLVSAGAPGTLDGYYGGLCMFAACKKEYRSLTTNFRGSFFSIW
jgi:hypothetical protein